LNYMGQTHTLKQRLDESMSTKGDGFTLPFKKMGLVGKGSESKGEEEIPLRNTSEAKWYTRLLLRKNGRLLAA